MPRPTARRAGCRNASGGTCGTSSRRFSSSPLHAARRSSAPLASSVTPSASPRASSFSRCERSSPSRPMAGLVKLKTRDLHTARIECERAARCACIARVDGELRRLEHGVAVPQLVRLGVRTDFHVGPAAERRDIGTDGAAQVAAPLLERGDAQRGIHARGGRGAGGSPRGRRCRTSGWRGRWACRSRPSDTSAAPADGSAAQLAREFFQLEVCARALLGPLTGTVQIEVERSGPGVEKQRGIEGARHRVEFPVHGLAEIHVAGNRDYASRILGELELRDVQRVLRAVEAQASVE